MAWYTAGIQTNPITNAILADTGAIAAAGTFNRIYVMAASTVTTVMVIEHMNAANTAVVASDNQAIIVPAFGTSDLMVPLTIDVSAGERIRIRLNGGITGSCQASIITQ